MRRHKNMFKETRQKNLRKRTKLSADKKIYLRKSSR